MYSMELSPALIYATIELIRAVRHSYLMMNTCWLNRLNGSQIMSVYFVYSFQCTNKHLGCNVCQNEHSQLLCTIFLNFIHSMSNFHTQYVQHACTICLFAVHHLATSCMLTTDDVTLPYE